MRNEKTNTNRPEKRINVEYSRRLMRRLILVGALSFLLGIPVFLQFGHAMNNQVVSSATVALIIAWIAVVLAGATWVGRLELDYHCPTCDAHLPRQVQNSEDEQRFFCQDCNIIWLTGVRDGTTSKTERE
jgi:hypothetical protein